MSEEDDPRVAMPLVPTVNTHDWQDVADEIIAEAQERERILHPPTLPVEVWDARRALAEWELAREHNDWVVEQADDMAEALAALLKMPQNNG